MFEKCMLVTVFVEYKTINHMSDRVMPPFMLLGGSWFPPSSSSDWKSLAYSRGYCSLV